MQVKVIFHRGPAEEVHPRKEIRRFTIDKVDSFSHLKDKVIMLYDDLTAETPLRFFWTDDEGDNVLFSSDVELKEAINFFASQEGDNKLFKLIVRVPQPPPPHPAGVKRGQNQKSENGWNPTWKDAGKMEKKIQKIHDRQCKRQMMSQLKSAAAAGQPLEAIMTNFRQHFGHMMAPDEMMDHTSTTVIPINGTVISNGSVTTTTSTSTDGGGASVTKTTINAPTPTAQATTSSSTMDGGVPVATISLNSPTVTITPPPSGQEMDTTGTDGFEDVSEEVKQQMMKDALEKMTELGFAGEWVAELLKSVDGDVASAIQAMNPEK